MPLIEDAEFAPLEETAEPESPLVGLLAEFDPKCRDDFTGLLHLGALVRKFTLGGHKFVIRTLRTEEILAIGLVTKEYMGTAAANKAYSTAIVACCITTVDGRAIETPFREETAAENLQFRMDHVGTWSPFIIDAVYNEYLVLDGRVNDIFEAMGKVSG